MRYSKFAACACALALLTLTSISRADVLVDYKPLPASPTLPEFTFGGGVTPFLSSGPGSIGNADGILPLIAQTAGGLGSEAPFVIPGIPGGNILGGSTTFYDTSLILFGLSANAFAINAAGTLIQPLGAGSFELYSTDPDGLGPMLPVLLLSGNIAGAKIVGEDGGAAGAVFNASGVTYTGGSIYTALITSGGSPFFGSMSISMTDVTPSFGIGGSGYLNDFSANATGLFSYNVPEPTTASLMLIGAALVVRRRHDKRI